MAFVSISGTVIEAGDPVTQDLWTQTKDNLDDLNTRTTSLEGGSNVAYVHRYYQANGPLQTGTYIGGHERLPFNITVNAARLQVVTAGTSGSTEIDFKYKRGAGAWTSIFSTLPSVIFSDGDYTVSTSSLLAGDLIRMDITAVQGGTDIDDVPRGLLGFIEFEKT